MEYGDKGPPPGPSQEGLSPPSFIGRRMRVADLGLDPRIVDVLKAQGIEELYPPQADARGPAGQGREGEGGLRPPGPAPREVRRDRCDVGAGGLPPAPPVSLAPAAHRRRRRRGPPHPRCRPATHPRCDPPGTS